MLRAACGGLPVAPCPLPFAHRGPAYRRSVTAGDVASVNPILAPTRTR